MSISRSWFVALLAALIVSAMSNVLLLGWLAGERAGESVRVARGAMQQLAHSLPPELRDELRRELRERAGPLAQHARAAREARREVAELLQESELDRPRLDAQLALVREHTSEAQRLLQDAMVSVAAKADTQSRRQWLDQAWSGRGAFGQTPAESEEEIP